MWEADRPVDAALHMQKIRGDKMTWYLVFRALSISAFVAAFGSLFGAGIAADCHNRAWPFVVLAAVLAITGCLLIGLGWTPEHP